LRHCTASWIFDLNTLSAGIEVTPAMLIARRDAPAEPLYWPAGSNRVGDA
jgi:hypothetical protein